MLFQNSQTANIRTIVNRSRIELVCIDLLVLVATLQGSQLVGRYLLAELSKITCESNELYSRQYWQTNRFLSCRDSFTTHIYYAKPQKPMQSTFSPGNSAHFGPFVGPVGGIDVYCIVTEG